MFLKILQNSQENTCTRVSFLIRRLWRRCFPVNFAKFLRTPPHNCFGSSVNSTRQTKTNSLKLSIVSTTCFSANLNHVWRYFPNVSKKKEQCKFVCAFVFYHYISSNPKNCDANVMVWTISSNRIQISPNFSCRFFKIFVENIS